MIDIRGLPQRDYQPPSAADEDPDVSAIRRVARQRAQAGLLQEREPADVLRARQLSRETGVPAPAIEGDFARFEQQVLQQNAARALQRDPWLAQYLGADPNIAAAAKNDIPRLGNISKLIADEGELSTPFIDRLKRNNLGETALGSPSMRALGMEPAGRSIIPIRPRDENFEDLAARARSAPQTTADKVQAFGRDLMEAPGRGLVALSRGFTGLAMNALDLADEFDPVSIMQRQMQGVDLSAPIRGALEGQVARNDQYLAQNAPESTGLVGAFVQGVEQIPTSIAALGLTLMGQPQAGLGLLGGATAGSSYLEAKEAGLSTIAATTYGVSQGSIEAATEALPVLRYLKDVQLGSSFGKKLLANWATEQVGEQSATVLQDLNRWAAIETNQGKTFGDYLAERPEAALHTAVAVTATTLGTQTGIAAVERLARETTRARREEAGALAGAQLLDNLMREAEASEMRKGDPETFREFVEKRTEGTPVQNLYLPIEAVEEYMQSEGYEAGFLELYQDQFAEAATTRGDVVIPVAEAAARMAGTPAWEALKDQVRLQPGGISQKEALERSTEIVSTLEQRGAEIAQEAAAEGDATSPTIEVYESVRNELLSVGRSSTEAEKIAQLLAARREAAGARLGMTAAEYHAANPIAFADGATGARAGGQRTLAQEAATPEFKRWFGDSKIVDEKGAPLVVYHGSARSFESFDLGQAGSASGDASQQAIFFSSDPSTASKYAEVAGAGFGFKEKAGLKSDSAGVVYPVHLRINHPYISKIKFYNTAEVAKEIIKAKKAGHDGVVFPEMTHQGENGTIAVFEPTQIKSVNNVGTFDRNDPRILHQDGVIEPDVRRYNQPAYHGSPHLFDRFSLDHIGSGEGAQAYGWGLYFAGRKEIADHYRRNLSHANNGLGLSPRAGARAEQYLTEVGGDLGKALARIDTAEQETLGDLSRWTPEEIARTADPIRQEYEAQRQYLRQLVDKGTPGRLYEVEIPEDGEYLLWDKPLSEQPDEVKTALDKGLQKIGTSLKEIAEIVFDDGDVNKLTGQRIYEKAADLAYANALERMNAAKNIDGKSYAYNDLPGDRKAEFDAAEAAYTGDTQRTASLALHEAGIAGIKYLDGGSRGAGDGSYNYVVFDDSRVQIRSYEQGPRGSATFYADGSAIVTLFDTANLSTLIHELGHVFLEEMFRDAQHPNAPTELKEDVAKIRNWFAANGAEIKKGVIPVEAHELWARGFERYAMEGKAPSVELQGVFTSFRAWLLRIYQVVQNLKAPITSEIREVFDRMLATQEAIDEAREAQNVAPLSQEALGMTDAEYAAYLDTVGDARNEAYDALLYKTMEAIRRRETKKMREQRANVRADVAAEVNARPEFVALHLLRTGRWLGDPEREAVSVKLNSGWLMDTYGEEVIDKLPKGLPIHKGDGEEGDVVAEMVGFASGDQLVRSLIMLREASDELKAAGETRSIRDKMIDDQVDTIMAARHGDVMTDGSIEEEAIAAINTARQGEIIAGEARQLAKRKSVLGTPTPYQFVREWARRKISAGRVQEVVSRSALQRYTRATAKAARLAEQAILEENVDEAYRQKQAQLLNHALLAEGKVVADEIEAIIARMNRLAKRAAMKSVDQDYMDRIHEILEKYDFRPRSQRSIDEADSFAAWADAQRAKGFEVHVPPRLMERGDHYSRLTVEELLGINDTVKSLLHLGKTKQKLKVAQEERDFHAFRDEVLARLNQLPTRKLPDKPINEEERRGAGLASELLKVEVIVEELDGGATGPLHDLIVTGATEAANLRDQLRDKVLIPIAKTYKQLSRKQWKRLQEKVTISELTWNTLNEGDPRLGQPVTITRMELLAIYMNMGNLSNLEKLSKGERWPVQTLQAVIRREFDKSDYDLAQTLWNQVGALWPDIVRVERAVSGVVPEQVEPLPIETPFGTYEGGYWPVVYDSSRSQRAEDYEGQRLDDMFGLKSGVATQKGHTITRTDAVGPFNLSLERVLFDHIEQVITRVAYTEYVREVLRVIKEPRIRGLIDTKLGPEYRKQIEPWIARQIHEGAVNAKAAKWWQKVLRHARINMTIAAMGFRFSTGVAQTLGLAASAERIGAVAVASGLKRMAANPREAERFVAERSPEMMKRTQAVNRDVAEVFAKLRGKHSVLTEAQAWAFWHIGMIDRYAVAMPTWLGAHEKAMSEGLTDAEASAYADKAVRLSQGSGREKDLSAWQSPNNEAMRYFTMFYTPFNVMFNAQWQAVRGLKRGDPRKAIGVTFWWLFVSTLGDALLSGDWPEDDDGAGWTGDILGWFARNVGFGMFAGLPLARDAANYGERKLLGEYAKLGTPLTRVIESVEQAAVSGWKFAVEGEAPQRPIKQIGDLTAILGGVPTSQAGTTAQFLWDVQTGEAEPDTISDYYFGVTRGKTPDE